MRSTGRSGAALAAVAMVLAGCSSTAGEPAGRAAPQAATRDPTTALRERCLSAIPEDADLGAVDLTGRTGGDIEGARIGPAANDTVAVLLPQVGGMCGWGRWADAAAEGAGLTSLLLNPCGYGESTCTATEDADPLNEVAPAVALARDELGAERVALIGTSMGGSLTVIAVAEGADVDAWADISGPPAWDGVELTSLARDLSDDGLVVMAPSEGRAIFTAARTLARRAGVPFVAGRSGHGWELLVDPVSGRMTPLGRRLVEHASGVSGE